MFTKQLEAVEAELRRSLQTVRERDASVRALAAENDALKDTVKSLVSITAPGCMDC
jgi:cell shape-determining protein MreC